MVPFASGVYLHQKGNRYRVIGTALDTTNARSGSEVVIYQPLDGSARYCRDLKEFIEEIEWPDGVVRPRFVFVGDGEKHA